MSRVGSTVLNITVEELLAAMQQAGGGLATGNSALASSLASQSRTISDQTEQIRILLGELGAANRRVAELERLNFEARKWEAQYGLLQQQWEAKVSLARESLTHEKETRAEMLGFVKTAAFGLLAAKNGSEPAAPPSVKRPPAEAPARESKAQAREEGVSIDAELEAPTITGEERLGDVMQVVLSRLSPDTRRAILDRLEVPNPKVPSNLPTIVAIVNLVFSCLDDEVAMRAYNDIGHDLFTQVRGLMSRYAGEG